VSPLLLAMLRAAIFPSDLEQVVAKVTGRVGGRMRAALLRYRYRQKPCWDGLPVWKLYKTALWGDHPVKHAISYDLLKVFIFSQISEFFR